MGERARRLLIGYFALGRSWAGYAALVPFPPQHRGAYVDRGCWFGRVPGSSARSKLEPFDEELEERCCMERRDFLSKVCAVASVVASSTTVRVDSAVAVGAVAVPKLTPEVSWPLGKVAFSLLPLTATSTRRATVEKCIVPDTIWTFDQLQGIVNVNVPVRQTVIRLSDEAGGGLLVHNPVAPTRQLLKMMKRLESSYGPVRHILLGTVALEHKATFGPFAQNYPNATVWIQPGQWSFPFDLPIEFEGIVQRGPRLREIPAAQTDPGFRYYSNLSPSPPEWKVDIDYETLDLLRFKSVGGFSETAFFHKSTRTLIVTDAVVSVTDDPPLIIQDDPRALLFHARDSIDDVVVDNELTRKKGWRRMVQFGLVFFPSQIAVVPFFQAFSDLRREDRRMKELGKDGFPLGLYPWSWQPDDVDLINFEAISNKGSLFCPPILTKLILDREPDRTLEWVDRVCTRFDFKRVIPSHLNNDIVASPTDFQTAFEVLRSNPADIKNQRPLAEDLALLQKASDLLTRLGVVDVSKVCDGEPARKVGRFASR